jgi:hypothetical protein
MIDEYYFNIFEVNFNFKLFINMKKIKIIEVRIINKSNKSNYLKNYEINVCSLLFVLIS